MFFVFFAGCSRKRISKKYSSIKTSFLLVKPICFTVKTNEALRTNFTTDPQNSTIQAFPDLSSRASRNFLRQDTSKLYFQTFKTRKSLTGTSRVCYFDEFPPLFFSLEFFFAPKFLTVLPRNEDFENLHLWVKQ